MTMYDPNKTQLMGEDPAPADPTRLVGADPTTVAPAPVSAADLDDPYRSPVALEDLTSANMPVQLQSPVKSANKRHLPIWAVALLVVLALAACGGAVWYTYQQELWGGRTVPLVLGLDQETAQARLEDAGFAVSVQTELADEHVGEVTACTPEPGTRADAAGGATITVAAARTIPQVVGTQMEAAQQALAEQGAANVVVQSVNANAEAGTVVAVSPEAGATFKSTDQITLQVASPYVIPDVMGATEDEAVAAVEKAGLVAHVTYVESAENHNVVVGVSPDPGVQIEAGGTVELQVSSPYPQEHTELLAYFDASSKQIATYLEQEKYSLVYGATFPNGDAHAVYSGEAGDMLTFTATPEIGAYADGKLDDVLAAGAPISGVRYVFAVGGVPAGADAETTAGLRAVMQACGLDGLRSTCTAGELEALGAPANGMHFICGYGETGTFAWAVIIGGREGASNVVALASLKSHFNGGVDLSKFGGSAAAYIAYADLYGDPSTFGQEVPADEQSADQPSAADAE